MSSKERKRYHAALGIAWACNEVGNAALRLLKKHAPEEIWNAAGLSRLVELGMPKIPAQKFLTAKRALARSGQVERTSEYLDAEGMRFVPYLWPGYPPQLQNLSHPPVGLFMFGREERLLDLLRSPRVTIVGTRRATAYGTRAARDFASAFAARGVAVISGMALGVDGRAHEAALEADGLTAAVLGCGADVVYPRRHRGLYDTIAARGLVLSELPPGVSPSQYTFPQRNRLLAALGDAVLVVEGSVTSGAMQTAELAVHLGRPVFALPGSIYADGHRGCNLLIRDGGTPAIEPGATVEEFLLQTRIERGERRPPEPERSPGGSKQDPFRELAGAGREVILEAMDDRPVSIDALVMRTTLAARQLTAALAELELAGLVMRAGPGLYIRAP